jgi:hypothetical protein
MRIWRSVVRHRHCPGDVPDPDSVLCGGGAEISEHVWGGVELVPATAALRPLVAMVVRFQRNCRLRDLHL